VLSLIAAACAGWFCCHAPLEAQPALSLPSVCRGRLFVITDSLAQVQYASMLASVDIFVLPTRGEGWGLPMVSSTTLPSLSRGNM
jgi:hypothetical protein